MSTFLTSLITRSFATAPAVQPRVPSLFESSAATVADAANPVSTASIRALTPAARSASAETSVLAKRADSLTAQPRPPAPAERESPPPLQPVPGPLHPDVPPPSITQPPARQVVTTVVLPSVPPPTSPVVATRVAPKRHLNQTLPSPSKHLTPELTESERAAATPAIHVTIGRVEVRAIQPPPATPRPARRSAPKLSLGDYLQQRSGGAR